MVNLESKRWVLRLSTFLAAAHMAFTVLTGDAEAFNERIIHDRYSGLAIGGYDPVTFFISDKPRIGDPEIEVEWEDSFWRFVNQGNADAFAAAPAAYIPAYGGYGVIGVTKGVPQPGDPTIYVIHANRIFMFNSEADRTLFLTDPEGLTALADAKWPTVSNQLAR
jgi:hypothetical protein